MSFAGLYSTKRGRGSVQNIQKIKTNSFTYVIRIDIIRKNQYTEGHGDLDLTAVWGHLLHGISYFMVYLKNNMIVNFVVAEGWALLITSKFELITRALIKGQANRVKALTLLAIENGIDPRTVLEKALMPGMQEISGQFRDNIIYISDVLIASRAMQAGLHVLKPFLSNSQQSSLGKVVVGTVAGDLHEIGKNLVVMMFRGAGLEVIDLGIDVQPEDFAQAIIDHQPDILAMSAMLTTTLGMMSETIRELDRQDLRNKVKIIIGGSPATQEFARAINADGFAVDVMKAVDLAIKLIKESVKH